MEWKRSVCGTCKKEILSPSDAIYVTFTLHGDVYQHTDCCAKIWLSMLEGADKVGVPAAAIAGSPVAGLSIRNTVSDITNEMRTSKREIIQKRVAKNFGYGVGVGAIMSVLGGLALLSLNEKTGLVVAIAGGLLLIFGLAIFSSSAIAIMHRAQFEKMVAGQK